jgi:multidrug efflux system outer membrane protein
MFQGKACLALMRRSSLSRIFFKNSLWLAAPWLLTACMVGSDYKKPDTSYPSVWKEKYSQSSMQYKHQEQWWKIFHDKMLDKLIIQMLKQNYDRKIAEARLLEARGLRMNSSSALYPEIKTTNNVFRGNPGLLTQNKTLNFYQSAFDASYEIDLFGGNRRKIEASKATVQSNEASYRNITITLLAEIVSEYTTLREIQQQHEVTKKIAQSQKKLAQITKIKYKHGAASTLEVSQSDALYQDTLAKLPPLARAIKATIYRISVLISSDNEANLENIGPIPKVSHVPIMDAPAIVLSRRPDVAMAERDLAASTALTAVAISELYPKVSLSALFGWQDTTLLPKTIPWAVASSVAMPILNFGRIEGAIKAANAREQQAMHAYKKSITVAIADVETKISDYSKNREHRVLLQKALKSNKKALETARKRYVRGMTPIINVLEAETKVYGAENSYISSQADEVRAAVALEKACGW